METTKEEPERTLVENFEINSIEQRNTGLDTPKKDDKQLHTIEVKIANLQKENENLKRELNGKPH